MERGVMTSAVEAPAGCPQCSADVVVDVGYSPWCANCGWNLDPYPPTPSIGQSARAAKGSATRLAELDSSFTAAAGGGRGPAHRQVLAIATAIAVHTVTLSILAAAIWIGWASTLATFVRWPLGLLMAAVALFVAPRRTRVPRRTRLLRDQAPHLWALIDHVAASAQCPPAAAVVVTDGFGTASALVGWRRRRVLNFGREQWFTVGPAERVACIAEELASGRSRHLSPLAGGALSSLYNWLMLLQRTKDGRARRGMNTPLSRERVGDDVSGIRPIPRTGGLLLGGGRGFFANQMREHQVSSAAGAGFWNLLIRPLRWLAARAASQLLQAQALRAAPDIVRADRAAATVASTAAAVELLEHSSLGAVVAAWEWRHLSQRRQPDWADLRTTLDAVPAHQRERLRRLARARGERTEPQYPATALRIDALRAAPAAAGTVYLSDSDDSAITAELSAASRS